MTGMTGYPGRVRGSVIGVPIDALDWATARRALMAWAMARESKYVCICNVHSVVTASGDQEFLSVIESSDMATPDGAPVAWTLRRRGFRNQPRVNGPDLMWKLCGDAAASGVTVGLLGSTDATLTLLKQKLAQSFPSLVVAFVESPPFRDATPEEDALRVQRINQSGIGLLFVGLGCPKQERWMAAHRGKVEAVMLGVGAAFDYHAGTLARAPDWMRNNGLEWFHRLITEPRRLAKRYAVTNSLFLLKSLRDWLLRPTTGSRHE